MEEFFKKLLDDREARALRQEDLIEKYNRPIISYMLNTPGVEKSSPKLIKFHQYGFELIKEKLGEKIIESNYYPLETGMYYLIAVDEDPVYIKRQMIEIEEKAGGRLFDIDVFDQEKKQLSRSQLNLPKRKCILCGQPAKNCIVGKKHSYGELVEKMYEIIDEII